MVHQKKCHRLSNRIYSAPGIFFIEECSGSGKDRNYLVSFDVPEFYDEFYRNLDAEIVMGPVASHHSYVSSRDGSRTVAETFWKISKEQCGVRQKGKDFLLDKKMDCPML